MHWVDLTNLHSFWRHFDLGICEIYMHFLLLCRGCRVIVHDPAESQQLDSCLHAEHGLIPHILHTTESHIPIIMEALKCNGAWSRLLCGFAHFIAGWT